MHVCIPLQSFGALGAALGAPCAWPVSEWFGRKPALMLGGVPGVIGWLMITYAHYVPIESGFLAILLVGRILTGFQAGWSVFCISVSQGKSILFWELASFSGKKSWGGKDWEQGYCEPSQHKI